MSTVAAALAAARGKLPPNEARLLLGHVLQQSAAWLLTHDDAALDEDQLLAFASLVSRRAGGEPVAYLLGHREFMGRDFYVAPGVLIPRPETELLVELALSAIDGGARRVLELGTGSGCIAASVALARPQAAVTALDISPAALTVAQRNCTTLGATVRLLPSDWFAAIGDERYDLILSNPPYIPNGDPHLAQGDLRFEPPGALASGDDGLAAIRHIVGAARAHLVPGGRLWFEHGYDQATAVAALLAAAGYADIVQHRDLAGIVRVSGGSY